ncbi:Gfo/Idh/MocA family protein [Denitrobaculum tricleocarpae]|uniref:Gfo/Idh/MocA family oxidoreductase n=1 Tax=Denitrobaculum tricleocarpae TaxID=2591009 RepID=A0A545TB55_9PROT|nr:Gfo/Idh/MocA family oxidoreductase [Denitrobaculum tricleocarpae]TQV74447.1 Gfo/Idh/MocA family oxidoreductase [Denitrobaculum tricleocarpae]
MNQLQWGIVGCGDVTEVKSGPALQKASRSSIAAVMRRDGEKAADYARRHGIAKSYDSAQALIGDPDVNAVYIATPPDSHCELTLAALKAGKPVLVEKPMSLTVEEGKTMAEAAKAAGQSLVVAFYRRALPRFEHMREIVQDGTIGTPRCVSVVHRMQAPDSSNDTWRLDPKVGGGGFFADMQSHTIDWLSHVFGPAREVQAQVRRQSKNHAAEDLVSFSLGYQDVVAAGLCAYSVGEQEESVTVLGDKGSVSMGFFRPSNITVKTADGIREIERPDPPHVHQPFVEKIVAHLLDGEPNPCSPEVGLQTMEVLAQVYKGFDQS